MSNLNNSTKPRKNSIITHSYNSLSLSTESPPPNNNNNIDPFASLPKPPITSTRFFFSPTTTKSLIIEEETKGPSTFESFLKKSVKLSMASEDPYGDFKQSMEEMVEAYRIRELPRLQELLHCYLKLNQRKDHKAIMLAFVDLFLDLVAHNKTTLC